MRIVVLMYNQIPRPNSHSHLELGAVLFDFSPSDRQRKRLYEYLKVSVLFELCDVINPSSRMFQMLLKVIIDN